MGSLHRLVISWLPENRIEVRDFSPRFAVYDPWEDSNNATNNHYCSIRFPSPISCRALPDGPKGNRHRFKLKYIVTALVRRASIKPGVAFVKANFAIWPMFGVSLREGLRGCLECYLSRRPASLLPLKPSSNEETEPKGKRTMNYKTFGRCIR